MADAGSAPWTVDEVIDRVADYHFYNYDSVRLEIADMLVAEIKRLRLKAGEEYRHSFNGDIDAMNKTDSLVKTWPAGTLTPE